MAPVHSTSNVVSFPLNAGSSKAPRQPQSEKKSYWDSYILPENPASMVGKTFDFIECLFFQNSKSGKIAFYPDCSYTARVVSFSKGACSLGSDDYFLIRQSGYPDLERAYVRCLRFSDVTRSRPADCSAQRAAAGRVATFPVSERQNSGA